jgi:DNA-binding beta-propeller fold protein YncE
MIEIDPATETVVARHRLEGGTSPHGLELIPDARLAFVACEGDAKLLVLDLKTWKTIESFRTGDGPDVLAFDDELGLLYVGTESEVVSVFHLTGNNLDPQGDVKVGPDAHSVAIDPSTHEVFIPLKNVGGRPVLRVMQPEK